jgi:rubrerythrin
MFNNNSGVLETITEEKPYLMDDPPSCEFLERAVRDEEEAVEMYMSESYRTNDPLSKKAFHAIAVEEMEHLKMFEYMARKIKCPFMFE